MKWSQHDFADRWNVDCKRKKGLKGDANTSALSNQKEGVAVSEVRKCMGGTYTYGVTVGTRSLTWGKER